MPSSMTLTSTPEDSAKFILKEQNGKSASLPAGKKSATLKKAASFSGQDDKKTVKRGESHCERTRRDPRVHLSWAAPEFLETIE